MKSFKFTTLCLAMVSFSWLSSKANVIRNQTGDEMLNHWLTYIHEQEDKFEIGPEDEAVIILGNGHSGKTTLSLLLTDAEMDGHAEPDGSFRFVDSNDRIASGITPEDKFPLITIDDSSDTIYYDWIGFEVADGLDTDFSIKHDILLSHLIKNMANSSKALKFVFTISHKTFDPSEYMGTFLDVVQRATNLIKNIDKYHDSIAMVVTKVRGQYNSKIIDSHDWQTEQYAHIEGIATYLRTVLKALELKLKDRDYAHGYTTNELKNMKKFINILLTKQDGHYQRIGIFHEPQEPLPVKYMTIQQHEKTAIRKMIKKNLHFVISHADDFGYAVTKQTENDKRFYHLKAHLEH